MSLPVNEALISHLQDVLAAPAPKGRQKEQVIQDFLEENSSLIPMHKLENHGLHFNAIISKFPLGTSTTTDWAFLSKSSSRWVVTFVELESPDKAIFTADMDRPVFSAAFNSAVAQVEQWMHYVEEHRSDVRESLSKLLNPLKGNKLTFAYQLVIGRSSDKNLTDDRKAAFEMRRDKTAIDIFTYDALISHYRNGPRAERNVLVASKQRFKFRRLQAHLGDMLAWIGPDALNLSVEQHEGLLAQGYEMGAWSKGELLSAGGGRRVLRMEEEMREIRQASIAAVKKRAGGSD